MNAAIRVRAFAMGLRVAGRGVRVCRGASHCRHCGARSVARRVVGFGFGFGLGFDHARPREAR